jgi:hypothetical protein
MSCETAWPTETSDPGYFDRLNRERLIRHYTTATRGARRRDRCRPGAGTSVEEEAFRGSPQRVDTLAAHRAILQPRRARPNFNSDRDIPVRVM